MSSAPYDKASAAATEQRPPQYAANSPAQPQYGSVQAGAAAPQYGQQAHYGYDQQAYYQQAPASYYIYPVSGQAVTATALPPPPTYLAWSIISLLFFCLPLGIAAVVVSLGVSNDYAAGLHVEARRKSSIARTLNIISTVLGCVIYIIIGVWVGVAASTFSYVVVG